MPHRLGACVLGASLILGGCTSTSYVEDAETITLTMGTGGLIGPIRDRYNGFLKSGKKVVVDGQVVSADAFFAFAMPDVCYTENVVFSPHSAAHLGIIPSPEITEVLAGMLPEPLRVWFENDISYHDWIGFAQVDFDQLYGIWPEGACDGALEASLKARAEAPLIVEK